MSELLRLFREVVPSLHLGDDRLSTQAESLPLPADATEMWESQIQTSAIAHLYAAMEAVRSDCIQVWVIDEERQP